MTIKGKKIKFYFLLFALLLVYMFLLALPATIFDNGKSLCVSMLLLNKQCYACGMTRAFQHIIHFQFEAAYHYNKLSFIAFPILCVLILIELVKLFKSAFNAEKK